MQPNLKSMILITLAAVFFFMLLQTGAQRAQRALDIPYSEFLSEVKRGDRFVVGSHLLTLWGFDQEVIDAVRSLSDEASCRVGGLPWYVSSARQLVMGDGLDPLVLASPVGEHPEVDAAIDVLRDVMAVAGDAADG